MILITKPLRHDLQELLRILLLATNARPEGLLERDHEVLRRNALLVYGPLVEAVENVFQRLSDDSRAQALGFRLFRFGRAFGGEGFVDVCAVERAPVGFADEVFAQVGQAGESLEDGIYEAV